MEDSHPIHFGLCKEEKLTSKIDIENLFSKGKSYFEYPIKAIVFKADDTTSDTPLKILIAVPKKIFKKAVDRNRTKRLIREAFRLNKSTIFNRKSLNIFHIGFIYSSSTILKYTDIENSMKTLLKRIIS